MARRVKSHSMKADSKTQQPILIRCLDRDTGVSAPTSDITVGILAADLELGGQNPKTWGFRQTAELLVPDMLDLPGRTKGDFTELAIDITGPAFPENPDVEVEIVLRLRGEVIGQRVFRGTTQRHFFLVTTQLLFDASNSITISTTQIAGAPLEPRFFVRVFYAQKSRLMNRLESDSIWLFSAARSGSTWLCHDILCWGNAARPMDEPGIGKLFAPLDWAAERVFDLTRKATYLESGLDYERFIKPRTGPDLIPTFERSFIHRQDAVEETKLWSQSNWPVYLDLLRQTTFEHVNHEWGMCDYRHVVFKMPNESQAADVIMQAFPQSFMVLLMRDGRDVMKSRFSPFASPHLAASKDPALRLYAIAYYAHLWNFQVDIMLAAYHGHAASRRLLMRYEDIRVKPAEHIRVLFDGIGVAISEPDLAALVTTSTLENIPAEKKGADKPRQTGQIGKYANVFSVPKSLSGRFI